LNTVNLFVRNVKQPSRRAIHPSKRVNLRVIIGVIIGVNATLWVNKGSQCTFKPYFDSIE